MTPAALGPVSVATKLLVRKMGLCTRVQNVQVLFARHDASTVQVPVCKWTRATAGLATVRNLTMTSEPIANKRGLLKRGNKSLGPLRNLAGTNRMRFAVEAVNQTGGIQIPPPPVDHAKAANPRKGKTTMIATHTH